MEMKAALEYAAAALSLLLMGACGVQLLRRLVRVLAGREEASGLPPSGGRPSGAPPREYLLAALAALGSRLLLFLVAYAGYRAMGGEDGFWASLEPLWAHWDARHYLGIAASGYTAVGDDRLRLVFFPLYPLLMRLAAPLAGGSLFWGGTLISLLCAALCGALVYDLARMHAGPRAGWLALAYFLLNPLSVFLCCVYTEALFLCLTLAAVRLLRADRPWLAALCGALSAFTRMPGLIVAGLFLIRLLGKRPRPRARDAAACVGQMALVFAGLAAYWAVNWRVTGDPFAYMTYQAENWYQQPGSFWQSAATTAHYFMNVVGEDDWLFTWGFQLVSMFYVYALLAFRSRRLPFDLAAYAFVYVAAVLAPTWLLSGARYLFALCALPMLQAGDASGKHAPALIACGMLLIVWTLGYSVAAIVY